MKVFIALIITLFVSCYTQAAAPSCHSTYGGYCQYVGKVKQIYVNSSNTILFYFEEAITPSDALIAGFTITNGAAARFNITSNPDFAKMFYSTALAAQASGRNVSIQMRGVEGGYLKFDRIWLQAPEQ